MASLKEKEKSEEERARKAKWEAEKRVKKSHEDPFDVDMWYDRLSDVTFRTEFDDMTLEEAKALRADYRERFLNGKRATEEEKKVLDNIEAKLDRLIRKIRVGISDRVADEDFGVFVRLSTRSPKDSSLMGEDATIVRVGSALQKSVREKHKHSIDGQHHDIDYSPTLLTTNDKVKCLMEAFGQDLKVSSAKAALMLLRASERVFVDLNTAVSSYKAECAAEGTEKAVFRMKYIVREWVDIPVGMEFRGFVNKVRGGFVFLREVLMFTYRDGDDGEHEEEEEKDDDEDEDDILE
eukprot:TRINITY_DN6141_c0_g2_i5.p1 TRINITY_DN6141_c0_g2~~TRINITY_DN6141_c0_g2_i5.p1  ORF type:complete len:294 (-),score=82.73 TRINITY_DN6141_c0_g2_i5:638-1519(-)